MIVSPPVGHGCRRFSDWFIFALHHWPHAVAGAASQTLTYAKLSLFQPSQFVPFSYFKKHNRIPNKGTFISSEFLYIHSLIYNKEAFDTKQHHSSLFKSHYTFTPLQKTVVYKEKCVRSAWLTDCGGSVWFSAWASTNKFSFDSVILAHENTRTGRSVREMFPLR